MGYNPLRRYRGSKVVDISLMGATFVIVVLLVVWAMK